MEAKSKVTFIVMLCKSNNYHFDDCCNRNICIVWRRKKMCSNFVQGSAILYFGFSFSWINLFFFFRAEQRFYNNIVKKINNNLIVTMYAQTVNRWLELRLVCIVLWYISFLFYFNFYQQQVGKLNQKKMLKSDILDVVPYYYIRWMLKINYCWSCCF